VLAKKLLDYDLDRQTNAIVRASEEFEQHIEKIKHPLDEFGVPYDSLKVCALTSSESDWIVSNLAG